MLLLILNVLYVLLAIGMIALILMQRGAGAQAGSGFGGGASATVFGSRGASNFMSKSTKWMAIAFFVISLFMAWYSTHNSSRGPVKQDLGLMAQVPAAPATTAPASGNTSVPNAPAQAAPATPSTTPDASVPTAPAAPSLAHGAATPASPASGG
jgi:preprotein translocase subunit SecG